MSRRPNTSVHLFQSSSKIRLLSSDSAPSVGPQPRQPQPSLFTRPSSRTHTEYPRRRNQLVTTTKLKASLSSHRFSPLQSSSMNGRDANWVWAQDPAWGNGAGRGTWNQGNQTNGTFFNPSAPAFAPLGPNASGYGSYGLAEIQRAEMERANQRAQVTRAHAAARERASPHLDPTWAQEEPAGYVQQQGTTPEQGGRHNGEQASTDHHVSRRAQRHQRHQDAHQQQRQQQSIQQLQQFVQQPEQFGPQDHFNHQQSNLVQQLFIQQQQQFLHQQQVHQGAFRPTAPNFNNNTQQPRFHTNPVQEQEIGLPTPPRTNSPSSGKQLPNQNPKPPAKGGKRRSNKPPPPPPTGPKAKVVDRDAIIPPSPASGGIPSPSEVYLLRASLLPRTLPLPQPLLVIIDLNGTLLYRPNSHKAPRHFVLRPGAAEFLTFCLSSTTQTQTFKVMIWSSARPANVAAMLDKLPLTKSQRSDLVAVWGRDKFGLSPEDYTRRVQCYKRLTKVWADPLVKSSYPHGYNDHGVWVPEEDRTEEAGGWVKGGWSQGNTVLIDDSKEKARSEPYNAVEIPEFRGDMTEDVLPRVRGYLEGLARQADVSTYMRVSPFKPV